MVSDMNVTMPKVQKHSWAVANKDASFPIENRSHKTPQSFNAFVSYLKSFAGEGMSQGMIQQKFEQIFRNFHVLVWLTLEDSIPGCGIDGVSEVISVLSDCKPANINKLLSTENWQTLLMLAREAS